MKNVLTLAVFLVSNIAFADDAQDAAIENLIKRATVNMIEKVQGCYGLTINTGSHFINKSANDIGKQYLNFYNDCVLEEVVKSKFNLRDKTQFDN